MLTIRACAPHAFSYGAYGAHFVNARTICSDCDGDYPSFTGLPPLWHSRQRQSHPLWAVARPNGSTVGGDLGTQATCVGHAPNGQQHVV